jgi:hypothetical protein
MKPSDEILSAVNLAREPGARPLTLDGGWELGDVQRVLIRLLEYLDEQHAAGQGELDDALQSQLATVEAENEGLMGKCNQACLMLLNETVRMRVTGKPLYTR